MSQVTEILSQVPGWVGSNSSIMIAAKDVVKYLGKFALTESTRREQPSCLKTDGGSQDQLRYNEVKVIYF